MPSLLSPARWPSPRAMADPAQHKRDTAPGLADQWPNPSSRRPWCWHGAAREVWSRRRWQPTADDQLRSTTEPQLPPSATPGSTRPPAIATAVVASPRHCAICLNKATGPELRPLPGGARKPSPSTKRSTRWQDLGLLPPGVPLSLSSLRSNLSVFRSCSVEAAVMSSREPVARARRVATPVSRRNAAMPSSQVGASQQSAGSLPN